MPPEMIATEKYKKKPAGSIIKCSSSSAKALSALGMANYPCVDLPELMNREMVHVANIGQSESSAPVSDFVLSQVSVVSNPEPGCEAGSTAGFEDGADEWENGTLGRSEEHVKVSDLDPQVVNDILLGDAESVPAASEVSIIAPTLAPDEAAPVIAPEPEQKPVVGAVSAKMDDVKVNHGNKQNSPRGPGKNSSRNSQSTKK